MTPRGKVLKARVIAEGGGGVGGGEKSSSAPHLNDDDRISLETSGYRPQGTGGSGTLAIPAHLQHKSASAVIDDRFMELDFVKGGGGGGKGEEEDQLPRDRSSSGGAKDPRMKSFSFSCAKDRFARTFFNKKNSGWIGSRPAAAAVGGTVAGGAGGALAGWSPFGAGTGVVVDTRQQLGGKTNVGVPGGPTRAGLID